MVRLLATLSMLQAAYSSYDMTCNTSSRQIQRTAARERVDLRILEGLDHA